MLQHGKGDTEERNSIFSNILLCMCAINYGSGTLNFHNLQLVNILIQALYLVLLRK
jgi:hypothetical protein